MNRIEKLYQQCLEGEDQAFYQVESDFCTVLGHRVSDGERPDCVTAFLTIADWFATAERSGVWTFYEAADPDAVDLTLQFLEQNGPAELTAQFRRGVHNYQDPHYAETCAYPDEWMEESDEMDAWIEEHRDWLYAWERKLLLDNRDLIVSLIS